MINFVFVCLCVLDGWNAPLIILTYRVVDELLDLACDILFFVIDFDSSQ